MEASSSPEIQHLSNLLSTDVVTECSGSFFEDVGSQDPLESIDHFAHSNQSYQRLAYAQGIAAAAAAPTAEYGQCVELLLPVIQQLARDPESEIRSAAVKQLTGLGTALYGKDAERSMRDIEATLLVCAQQCALDDDDEVSHTAIATFQQLVQLLPPARATAASKRAVDRLESNGSDDGTVAAVRLLAHTVRFWTPEALRRHVPRYVGRWASHREFSVREAVATCTSLVVPPMPLRLCHQVLLPAFYQLSRDQNWRVRRACALDLPRLAEALHHRPAVSSSMGCDSSSSAACQPQAADDGQPLGCCSSKASSCLSSFQRFGTDVGSSSGNALAASLAAAAGPQRNRSYPSLIVNRSPATSAQIMTKHPMHSSLIMDGLLAASSSCKSMPASPTGSDATSLAHDSFDDLEHTPQQQQHHHHHYQQQQQQRALLLDSEHPQQQLGAACKLQEENELLHDCWCALRQCMELLTADSSHWVKVAALSGLGPFLLQLQPCQLGQLLLGRFMSMAGSTVVIYEVSVALACAQGFGQLAVLLGPERWQDMRDAWHALQSSRDPQVLCEVVSCLPQLMTALGPVLTHREMMPALAALLQSHLTWIAGQLVQVMADLLEHLPPSGHELLLKTLPQIAANSGERSRPWRVRRDLALQLGRLASVAGPEAIENFLWPTAMSLCCDPVAAVRTAAASQVGAIMAALPAYMLQSQLSTADNCAACSSSKRACSTPGDMCQARTEAGQPRDAAVGAAAVSFSAAAPADADARDAAVSISSGMESGCSWQVSGQASTCDRSSADVAAPAVPASLQGRQPKARSSSSKGRGFGVRFALDHNISSSAPEHVGRSGLLSDLVSNGHSRSVSGCSSSMDFDELELPSALAPAPAGCFSPHSGSSSGDDSDNAAADAGSGSSGLSSSSSHSSDADALGSGRRSSSSSSSSDESGDDSSDSESEDNCSSGGGQGWCGTVRLNDGSDAAAVVSQAADGSTDTEPVSSAVPAAAAPSRPLYAMHPAMMPVGALSAAAAAAAASAPRVVPAAKRRAVPIRARSAGDLLRPQPKPAASSSGDVPGPLQHATATAGLKGRGGVRQLADSLPIAFLAAGGSSDDDVDYSSIDSSWLPEPAHAAPSQYLPCLVEHFGCSSSHQQRQLFVPLVMGLLAACHEVLSCAQQAQLLDRLEALAHDCVPGVRYAVAAALADVRVQAAALTTGQQHETHQEQGPGGSTEQQGPQGAEAVGGSDGAVDVLEAQQDEAGQQSAVAAVEPGQQQQETHQAFRKELESAAGSSSVGQDSAQPQLQPSLQEEQQHVQADSPDQEVHSEEQEAAIQEPQEVTHSSVPKGAHPLLGYQAYVQQLAKHSSVPAPTRLSASADTSKGSSRSTTSTAGHTSPVQHSSRTGAATSTGRTPPALPPRNSSRTISPAASSRKQVGAVSQPAATGVVAAGVISSKGRPHGAETSGPPAASLGAAVGPGDGGAAGGAGASDEAKAAEWLKKLSNCQQLERLMHVVALTTGPL